MARTRETGLYGPVKQFFEDQGFAVRSEVKDCDLAAVRGDDMVLVEMKSTSISPWFYRASIVFSCVTQSTWRSTVPTAAARCGGGAVFNGCAASSGWVC